VGRGGFDGELACGVGGGVERGYTSCGEIGAAPVWLNGMCRQFVLCAALLLSLAAVALAQQSQPSRPGPEDALSSSAINPAGAAANPGDLTWSRWEKGANGPEAIFRYMAPPNVALFEVGFCCLANDLAMVPFDKRPGVTERSRSIRRVGLFCG
jgi:hypothetical protein